MMTFAQPNGATFITMLKRYVTLFERKAFKQILFKSQKEWKEVTQLYKINFSLFKFITNFFLLVPPEVLVIIDNPSYFQDFRISFKQTHAFFMDKRLSSYTKYNANFKVSEVSSNIFVAP